MYYRRIRWLRTNQNYTQRTIAEYLEMQMTVYRRYEKGQREIPTWAVIKLADFYHTTTDYILGRTNQR